MRCVSRNPARPTTGAAVPSTEIGPPIAASLIVCSSNRSRLESCPLGALYGLSVGPKYKYAVKEMVSKNVVDTYASPVFKRKDKVLPRQALILEISAKAAEGTQASRSQEER